MPSISLFDIISVVPDLPDPIFFLAPGPAAAAAAVKLNDNNMI